MGKTMTLGKYFYPRPPRGGRRRCRFGCQPENGFLSTPSARRATHNRVHLRILYLFLSTPSARRATCNIFTYSTDYKIFLSTPSARRATAAHSDDCAVRRYFYPRPPRGGRPTRAAATGSTEPISIHALREEGDSQMVRRAGGHMRISIHALREEGDTYRRLNECSIPISIHALREEGDGGSSSV